MFHDVIIIDMQKDTKFTRFDAIILGSTFLTAVITFLIYIGFSLYKYIKGGVWVKSLSACEVFNLFCSNNFIIKLIGDLEAILFVSLIFGLYFLIHFYLDKK